MHIYVHVQVLYRLAIILEDQIQGHHESQLIFIKTMIFGKNKPCFNAFCQLLNFRVYRYLQVLTNGTSTYRSGGVYRVEVLTRYNHFLSRCRVSETNAPCQRQMRQGGDRRKLIRNALSLHTFINQGRTLRVSTFDPDLYSVLRD